MVDDRRASVLRAVVQQYIETNQPVSSSSVMSKDGINASSATVRSVMAELEDDGYLYQPHASAGRIPTDKGYRFFVDNLGAGSSMEPQQELDVRRFFDRAHGEIENMMHETGRLLSELTNATSVVVGPEQKPSATVRSAQIVRLSERSALVVVVLSDGAVEKCTVDLGRNVDDDLVQRSSTALAKALDNLDLAVDIDIETGDSVVDRIALTSLAALRGARQGARRDNLYVGGASNLASAFDAVEVVRNVLTTLEKQYVVVSLMRDLLDKGINVSIGGENKLEALEHCSLVIAPTIVDGESFGSVAVLGPTRMNYSRALAAVSVVSSNLGRRLEASNQ